MGNKSDGAPLKVQPGRSLSASGAKDLTMAKRAPAGGPKGAMFAQQNQGMGLCETEADWEFLQLSDLIEYQ